MENDIPFAEWLNQQLQRLNWAQADLARAAGVRPATIHKLLTSKSKTPDARSCLGIARALDLAPETVFRAAKLLPTEPEFKQLDDLKMVVAQLSDQKRDEILSMARVMLEFQRKGYAVVK